MNSTSSGVPEPVLPDDRGPADPANGGDPKTLNMPSYKNDNCVGTCSFTRSFRSVANTSVEYNVTLVDMVGTVTPSNFTVFPGQTVNVTVEIDATALVAGAVSFGELQLTEADPAPDSFTINPSVAITDAGYSSPTAGTTGMVCEDIVVSGLANAPYLASLDVSMSHNDWLADLTLKLANPNGDLLTILNQSSAGTGVTLDAGIPISFFDGAGASADTLGSDGGAFGGDPACTLDPCEFFPFPNAEATPPGSFADLSVGDPNGTWQICVGDSAVGDTGVLESATLNITGEPPRPDLHLPLVVTGFPEQPDIEVSPTALSATLDPDMTTDLTLTVINTDLAGAELNWSIAPDGTSAEVLEQAVNGTSGIISDFYTPDDTGVYSADDFVLTGETTISTMFFGGFVNNQDLPDIATAIEVQIFTDNGGVPNGHPEDGLGSAVASLNIPIADASLDLTDDGIGIDVVAANGSPISLPAGTYWVTVYPVNAAAAFATDRWNWFAGTPANGSLAHLIDPSNFFGGGTDWTDLISLGVDASLAALNYRMDTMSTCGAPWLSVTPTSGTIAIDASEDLTVTIDSTGMTPGIYTAAVCIDSDDTSSPRVGVPVTLTVDGPSDLIFADGFEGP